jgi:predicted HTH domain antitoxin
MSQTEDFIDDQLYENDDAPSLAKMAELAGVSWWRMRDILLEQGVDLKMGPQTIAEAQSDVDTLRNYLANHT